MRGGSGDLIGETPGEGDSMVFGDSAQSDTEPGAGRGLGTRLIALDSGPKATRSLHRALSKEKTSSGLDSISPAYLMIALRNEQNPK